VAWSPDGRTLAAITGDPKGNTSQVGHLYEWNAGNEQLLVSIQRAQFGDRVAFSPDGSQVATSWGDPHVIIYDVRSKRVARTLITKQGDQSLAYTHDGTLATGSWAGIVQLWNPASGAQLGRPTLVAAAPTTDISFDPSGDTFVTSGGSDGFPKLWTTSTLQQLGSDLPGDPGAWVNQAYTPDGRDIIVVSQTGRGWIWPATLGQWEQRACQVAGRNLTQEEWSRYVTGKPYSTICPGA
jgi:WD40 repeat protein